MAVIARAWKISEEEFLKTGGRVSPFRGGCIR